MNSQQESIPLKTIKAQRDSSKLSQPRKNKLAQTNIIAKALEKSGLSYQGFVDTLTQTAFQGINFWRETDLERLLVTASRYDLDPLNREIMMFEVATSEQPELLLVIGVDGWAKIMNSHPQFDGIEFLESPDLLGDIPSWVQCTIFRKDRKVPLAIKEYFNEAKTDQLIWVTHPKRMLRHKALVQCARLAFGLAGVYEPDEAMRIRQAKRQSSRLGAIPDKEAIMQKIKKQAS